MAVQLTLEFEAAHPRQSQARESELRARFKLMSDTAAKAQHTLKQVTTLVTGDTHVVEE